MMNQHEFRMRIALEEARVAQSENEVPVGAVIIKDGLCIAKAHNQREALHDPTAHAEVLALRMASQLLGRRQLSDCTLYVTLEPCPMCAGAIVMAELQACYFGAPDMRQGCCESICCIPQDPAFFHNVPCVGGVLETECKELLHNFFKEKRKLSKEG